MQMYTMPQNADIYSVCVHNVQFEESVDIFADLLGISWVFDFSTTLDDLVEHT